MLCAQDSLGKVDSDRRPADSGVVSQYACKRRTTIHNCNKIFTVSITIKAWHVFFARQWNRWMIFFIIFFYWFVSRPKCILLKFRLWRICYSAKERYLQSTPHSLVSLTSYNVCVFLPSVGQCRSELCNEAGRKVHTQDEEVAAGLDEPETKNLVKNVVSSK